MAAALPFITAAGTVAGGAAALKQASNQPTPTVNPQGPSTPFPQAPAPSQTLASLSQPMPVQQSGSLLQLLSQLGGKQ